MFKRRFLVFGLCAFLPAVALREYMRCAPMPNSLQKHTTSESAVISAAVRSLRPNYPYSIVAGGVYSPAELRVAIQRDSVVKKHYSDFDLNAARVVKLTDDQYEYVSFRMGNRVFWTHKKLRIPKGEVLLGDGHNYARTRCGNRLSDLPQGNTTALQPADEVLTLPPFSPALLTEFTLAEVPPVVDLPVLPYSQLRLAPVLPTPTVGAVQAAENWPPLATVPGMLPIAAPPVMGFPGVPSPTHPGVPNTPPVPPVIATPILPPGAPSDPAMPPAPEPGTMSLLGAGLVFAFLVGSWRRLH